MFETSFYYDIAQLNVRTDTHGGSSMLVYTDETTAVSYGQLNVRVVLKDLGIEVTMNSTPGNWEDPQWAREKALQAVRKSFTMEGLQKLLREAVAAGQQQGEHQAKASIRKVLGIEDPSYTINP